MYASFSGSGGPYHYGICGKSEGSPRWAGIVADFNEYAGGSLGFPNRALWAIGGSGRSNSFGRDITEGYNGLLDVPGATAPGYYATARMRSGERLGYPNLVEVAFHACELLEY